MGERIRVQLRRGDPVTFPYRSTIENTGTELIVKDSDGEQIGWFNRADVAAYWKENIPVKIADAKEELLNDLLADHQALAAESADNSDDNGA